ncbi:right-handed parallel beta-helix repeat-containing protein [Collimonas sp. PA-H2]|uniref:right-handed parallel beta-helix repeat-containing protein n=1 Tax=Collimonas sp. PA-H2 TaxID=1881062 RepID=UPI003512B27A
MICQSKSVSHAEYEDLPASESLDKKAPGYQPTGNLVEHMTIHAGWRGVVMGGGGNVLRDSTIDVDGHTAVYMYGPGSIIENNTIIIHRNGDAKPFDAAIKLRDAHGAVVRNNRIIYKGGWLGKAPAAVNLLDSTDVLIEGNTVENFDKLVRINGDSKYAEKDNSLK